MHRRTSDPARAVPSTVTPSPSFKTLAIALCLACSLCLGAQPAFGDEGGEAGGTGPASSVPSETLAPASIAKVCDPATAGSWEELFAGADGSSFSTDDVGRLWVDKSVYPSVEQAVAAGVANPSMQDADLDFLVGMSAFSSSASFRKEQTAPHDVVFVISLNSTLSSFHYDGKTYAEHLADALNEAIGRLMTENADGVGPADPTRVAVVGYSIDTTILMPLGTYRPDGDGDYIRYASDLPGGAGFRVTAAADGPQTATLDAPFKNSWFSWSSHRASACISPTAGA